MNRISARHAFVACATASLAALVLVASSLAAAEVPAELRRWFQPQAWQRDVDGPIVSLGAAGEFDDMHIFAPAVAQQDDRYLLWYCGSRGKPGERVFRLGLATGADGRHFEKHSTNPVLGFADNSHSVLTPTLARDGNGAAVREEGKLRMWFSSTAFGKTGLHTLHESTSADGIHWAEPSAPQLENAYCPSVLKTDDGYQMWFSDVSRRPWVIRHATSADGRTWKVTERPALLLNQPWEAEVLVYPTVLKVDGVYLMWYGSYDNAIRRQTTAIGFAVSLEGRVWHKHPNNPMLRPDERRAWESNYVGSGCVMRLADGSFRYWYASRTRPPFDHLYFAINTARWAGASGALGMPPVKGDVGILEPVLSGQARDGQSVDVLEVIDERNMIVRVWYVPRAGGETQDKPDPTFIDVWVHGIDTAMLVVGSPAKLSQVFRVAGNKTSGTTCGQRSMPLLELADGNNP